MQLNLHKESFELPTQLPNLRFLIRRSSYLRIFSCFFCYLNYRFFFGWLLFALRWCPSVWPIWLWCLKCHYLLYVANCWCVSWADSFVVGIFIVKCSILLNFTSMLPCRLIQWFRLSNGCWVFWEEGVWQNSILL